MFTRTTSRRPQMARPSTAPSFAVQRFIQPRLAVGPVDDPFEQEADRVAERVVNRLPAGSLLAAPVFPRAVQRQEAEEDQEKKRDEQEGEEVRLKAAGPLPASGAPSISPAVEAGIRQAAGGGRPLQEPVRGAMENAFGADFRLVRVHADSRSDRLNRSVGARAFTTGTDVFFRGGEFQPDSTLGRRLIAHELAHVVQQGMGRARPMTTLQRKVGFEFETGWKVKNKGALLEKGDRIGVGQQSGYKVESDDDGAMEFIVDPPLEVSQYLSTEIDEVFKGLDAYAGGLFRARDQHKSKNPEYEEELKEIEDARAEDTEMEEEDEPMILSPEFLYQSFSLSEATNKQGDKDFTVQPYEDGRMRANPQFTAGMTLGQVAGLPTALGANPLKSQQRTAAILGRPERLLPRMKGETYVRAGLDVNKLGGSVSDDLKGLVVLAASYLQGGDTSKVPYPKVITDGFLLSRTDFVGLFHLLPLHEKRYFVKYPDVWMNLVLDVAQIQGSENDKVYRQGILKKDGTTDNSFGPTRKEWLNGIVADRKDLMSFAINEEYEGMGRLETHTEIVSTADAQSSLKFGGIFEFRAGQTESLEQSEWRGFAQDIGKLLLSFQQDREGLLTGMEKNRRVMQGRKV